MASQPDLGATATEEVPGTLPHATEARAAAAGSGRPEPAESRPTHRSAQPAGCVLVVDDEPAIRELLVESLAAAGYHSASAADAGAALAWLERQSFDVMLCDLMMPEMSGVELLVKARLEAPDMSVVVVTAVGDIETALRSLRLGAYDYLVKPVSPGDVVLHVASAIQTRCQLVEARLAHQRLEENHRQLQEMAEVKDNLVQMLVHDLKSPLASAMGYMELLGRKGGESFSERHLRYLQNAYTSCKDVLRMTTTMLDVTRMEKGTLALRRAPLDLPCLLREAAAEVEPLLALSGGTVKVDCDPAAATLVADQEILRRVLSNLLSNAVKYSPAGCRIRIEARPGNNGSVVLAVADSGKGIPPEEQEAIFQKYYQLPAHRGMGGAGIGLAFCRMAVEAHGGEIWVESAPGQGSTFCCRLPLPPPPTAQETTLEDRPGGG